MATSLLFRAMFIIVPLLIVVVVVVMIVLVVTRARAARSAGLDPISGDIQIASTLNRSALLAPAQTVEERLNALDGLRQRGAISEQEYAAQRQRILGTI